MNKIKDYFDDLISLIRSAKAYQTKMGDINFYVSSHTYGFVETIHQAILHCILDIYLLI